MRLSSKANRGHRYYGYVDGLRAIAVLAVVVYHFSDRLMPSGLLGVDVFFVISGFVVSASVESFEGSFGGFLQFFYSRRFLRILPSLLVVIWLTSIFSLLFIPHLNFEAIARASHFGFANFALDQQRANYFSPQTGFNPFTHIWSLGVEEQFYLAFPFFAYALLHHRTRRPMFVGALAILCVASLLVGVNEKDPQKAFYFPWFRAWELAAGVLVYHLSQIEAVARGLNRFSKRRIYGAIALCAFLCIFVCLFSQETTPFPSFSAFGIVVATSAVLLLLENGEPCLVQKWLNAKSLLWIGLYSYVIYLVHWPVLVLFRWTVGNEGLTQIAAAVFVIAFLSWAIRRWVEVPLRDARKKFRPAQILSGGLIILVVSAIFSILAFRQQASITLSGVNKQIALMAAAPVRRADCEVVDAVEGWEKMSFTLAGPCQTKGPRVFVVGDSHTENYRLLFRHLTIEKGMPVTIYHLPGCPVPSFTGPSTADCRDFFARTVQELKTQVREGDFLFLPGFRLFLPGPTQSRLSDWFDVYNLEPNIFATPRPVDVSSAVDAAVAELKVLNKLGLKIIVEAPKPIFRAPVFRCADWFNHMNPVCRFGLSVNRSEQLIYRSQVLAAMVETQKTVEFLLFDPFNLLCPLNDGACEAIQDGIATYFDQDHLAPAGVMKLYPELSRLLE